MWCELQYSSYIFSITKLQHSKLYTSYLQDPIEVCRSLFGQLSGRDHRDYAAELTRLPQLEVNIATPKSFDVLGHEQEESELMQAGHWSRSLSGSAE